MNVLFLQPGFPDEMIWFTEGFAAVGARVFGVGDSPKESLHPRAARALTAYTRVRSIMDEDAVLDDVIAQVRQHHVQIDQVVCMWEPLMILAARVREKLGVPGMTVDETIPYRDKEEMKRVLDKAGIRTPRHDRAKTPSEMHAAAEKIGYPLIVKPIAGAGSADTYRVDDAKQLQDVIAKTRHVAEVSVEEFIDGQEYTFDTICVNGVPQFFNICWYRPRPLIMKTERWVSPQTIALRDVDAPELAGGRKMGLDVLKALRFGTGFTHMEWYRTDKGEVVFGEIGGRPPGARTVDVMNFASDIDLFRHTAEAFCFGKISLELERKWNAAVTFKRSHGEGRIQRVEGLDSILRRFGPHVAHVEISPIGAPQKHWKQILIGDGHVVMRHEDLATTLMMADAVATDLQIYAG